MTSQVIRPRVPYTGRIPNGLQDGAIVEIKGTVSYGREWFEVNLLSGMDSSYADRPLHISVRMNDNVAVRNTLVNNCWQTEERQGRFPFCQGQSFIMTIIVKSHCYTINVNNLHCWDFVHRIPFYQATALHIKGAVSIDHIQFTTYSETAGSVAGEIFRAVLQSFEPQRHVQGFPSTTCSNVAFPAYPEPVRPKPTTALPPVYNPSIPYAYPMYGGLKPGMMIYISGKPTMSPYRFTINLQAGTSPYNPPDVAFHFDVRFFNQTIVRNTRTSNAWHNEEKHSPSFPFMANSRFDMIIRVTKNQYMVAVNGQHFIEFRHRLWPLSRFDTLYIENDISVQSIRFA